MRHTPEPWESAGRVIRSFHDEGVITARIPDEKLAPIGASLWEANARRIVACVNKCAGLSTEALESPLFVLTDVARDFQELSVKYEKLLEQQDELLNALDRVHYTMSDVQSTYKWMEAREIAGSTLRKFKEYK